MNLNSQLAIGLPWCIAGGYAACPQLAGDMDVWVLAGKRPYMQGLEQLAQRMLAANPDVVPFVATGGAHPYSFDPGCRVYEVGHLLARATGMANRHIMVTELDSIEALLDCFDVSTHQCALDENGDFIKGRQWTPLNVAPVKLFDTPNTEARMEKIRQRYAAWWPSSVARQVGTTIPSVLTMR